MRWNGYCPLCGINFKTTNDCLNHRCEIKNTGMLRYETEKEQPKMTREEAHKLIDRIIPSLDQNQLLNALQALGLLKFDEPKKEVTPLYQTDLVPNTDIQNVRLELWPEGLVLWVGGEIVWKSWEKSYKIGDVGTIQVGSSKFSGKLV